MRRAPALLLLIAAFSHARDDVPFAQALADRGWFDLARAACEDLRNDPLASPADRSAAGLAFAGIMRREAQAEADPARKDLLSQQAEQEAQAFLAASPDHPRADEARLLLGEVARDRAEALAAKGDRARAGEQFKSSEDAFADVVRRRSAGSRSDATLLRAAYDLALAPFLRATALETGARRRDLLSASVRAMDEFRWEYDGAVAACDLAIFEGEACAELGTMDKAAACFDSPIGLKANGAATRAIVLRAFWAKARACAQTEGEGARKWWVASRDAADQMEQLCAASPEDDVARRLRMFTLLEKARAFTKLGDLDAAVRVAQRVAGEAGPWADEARRVLGEARGEVAEKPPAPPEPPEPSSAVGERLEREGKWTEAADAFRAVSETSEGYDLALAHLAHCELQTVRQAWDDASRDPSRRDAFEAQARDIFARAQGDLRTCQERSRHPEVVVKLLELRADLLLTMGKGDPAFLELADSAIQDLGQGHPALAPEDESAYHVALQKLLDRLAALKAAQDGKK